MKKTPSHGPLYIQQQRFGTSTFIRLSDETMKEAVLSTVLSKISIYQHVQILNIFDSFISFASSILKLTAMLLLVGISLVSITKVLDKLKF